MRIIVSPASLTVDAVHWNVLRQGLTLSLQQTVASLSTLELGFHQAQGLSGGKHRLAVLILISISCIMSLRGLR